MTDVALRIPMKMADNHKNSIAELIAGIKATTEIGDLHEARARAEALKAWAKVHGKTKEMRLDLLRIEVEAIVRIVELGGITTLPAVDRKAAQWLADMTPLDRAKFVNDSGSATTARGMCQAVWREHEVKEMRHQKYNIGKKLAEEPQPPKVFDEDGIVAARERATSIAGSLANITDRYIKNGAEFTIDELAEELIDEAGLPEEFAEDETIQQGVRDVCRRAVQNSPPLSINGTAIPRLIMARNGKKFVRIPVMNATVAHLDDMIAMRREQIEQDKAALQRLEEFAALVKARGGARPESRIGPIIASSITTPRDEQAAAS